MYRLYFMPGACSLAPHITLEELGVAYEAESVATESGDGSGMAIDPAFRAVNPRGRVPALIVDGELLTEAAAILTFLALRHPEGALLPKDAFLKGRCLEWLSWLSSTLHPAFAQQWRAERFTDDPRGFDGVTAKGRATIEACFAEIEGRLTGDFAVGERFSVVDPYLLVYWLWGRYIRLDMDRYPVWGAHAARVLERPATKRALGQEGLERLVG